MKKVRCLISVLSLGIFLLTASAIFAFEIGGKEVQISASETYVTRYIWRGQDIYADNDGAHQPSIDIAFPKLICDTDVSLNLWSSFPLNDGHQDLEELDYTLTFSNDITENFNLSLGYTYFDFPNTSSTADVGEPWVALSLVKIPALPIEVSFDLFAGYDFAAKSGGPDEGWYYSWGLGTEFPLPNLGLFQEGQTLGFGVTNWGNDGVADLEPSFLYATELSLSIAYEFGKLTVTPSVNYTINHKEEINNGEEELWAALECAYLF